MARIDSDSAYPPAAIAHGQEMLAEMADGTTGKVKATSILNLIDAKASTSDMTAALAGKADLVGGVIPSSQMPSIAITERVLVANEAARLALTTAEVQPGDVAVQADTATSWLLIAPDPAVADNWKVIDQGDAVTSVNGQVGTVVLAKSDIGLGNVDNTSDANKPVSTATQSALDGKVSKSGDTMSDTLGVSGAGGNPGLLMNSTLGFRHEHAAPIQEIIESDQPADSRLWRKRSNSGQMAWQSNNDDGSLQRVFMTHNRLTGGVDFGGASSVTVPANSGTGAVNQAARITARNPATGQLQIDGKEAGDTGWITIASWTGGVQDSTGQLGTIDTTKYTLVGTTSLAIRRIGNRVHFKMRSGSASNRMLTTTASPNPLFTTEVWPTGFRMGEFGELAVLTSREQYVPMFIGRTTVADLRIVTPSGPVPLMTPTANWLTEDPWPSALPV